MTTFRIKCSTKFFIGIVVVTILRILAGSTTDCLIKHTTRAEIGWDTASENEVGFPIQNRKVPLFHRRLTITQSAKLQTGKRMPDRQGFS